MLIDEEVIRERGSLAPEIDLREAMDSLKSLDTLFRVRITDGSRAIELLPSVFFATHWPLKGEFIYFNAVKLRLKDIKLTIEISYEFSEDHDE